MRGVDDDGILLFCVPLEEQNNAGGRERSTNTVFLRESPK